MFPIETARLLIEKISLKDAEFIYTLLNSPTWLQFIGDRNIKDLKKAKSYIEDHYLESYKINGCGSYKIILKQNGKPIGLCGFFKRDYLKSFDLGYAILPEYEGKGFAHEATSAIMNFGMVELKLSPILAITSVENKRSQKLLGKLGFNKKGFLKIKSDSKEVLMYST